MIKYIFKIPNQLLITGSIYFLHTGAEVLSLTIPYEIQSTEDMVELHRTYLDQHENVKIIVLGEISKFISSFEYALA